MSNVILSLTKFCQYGIIRTRSRAGNPKVKFGSDLRGAALRLPFTDSLVVSTKFDPELAVLADAHYSRQTVGSPQFMPPGRTIVIRDNEGLIVFGWLYQEYRDDGQEGYNCCIFRNESGKRSSSVILECEGIARDMWGMSRVFTYINPGKLRTLKHHGAEFCRWPPGRCFLEAGWKANGTSKSGLILLQKFV